MSLTEIPAAANHFAGHDSAAGLYFVGTGTEAELSGFDVCSGDLILPATVTNGIDTFTVTSIGSQAFFGCAGPRSVTIPDTVHTIGERAFVDGGITSVTLGATVATLGPKAFKNNPLSTIVFNSTLTTISASAFRSTALVDVVIPASVTTIESGAFSSISTLTSFLFEGSEPTAGSGVFTSSSNLIEVLHRPAHSFAATWAGLPTRALYRPPTAPTTVSATPGDSTATVSWFAPSVSDAPITTYTVTASPGGQNCTWSTGPLRCEVLGLLNDTAYTFVVTATSLGGTSASSSASIPVTPRLAVIPRPPPTTTTTTEAPPTTALLTPDVPPSIEPDVAPPSDATSMPEQVRTLETILSLPALEGVAASESIPGSAIELTVTGFVPGETVYVVIASTSRILTTGVADDAGTASLSGVVPSDIGPGDHTVALYAPGSGHGARQAITVTMTLPRWGTSWMVSLWASVLVGGGLMLWRTTRHSRSASMPSDATR